MKKSDLKDELEKRLLEFPGSVVITSQVATKKLEESTIRAALLIEKSVSSFSWVSTVLAIAMLLLTVTQILIQKR